MKTKRELKDLNLMDRFLFAEISEDPEVMQNILEIILGRDVVLKSLPQAEKEMRKSVWSKSIKLDVWAEDMEENAYNTEVQKRNTGNLPKRSRYYNAVIDSKMLQAGIENYNELKNIYIIMIMPFDMFGEGRYMYTFNMREQKNPDVSLEDGATRIFLNTKGIHTEGVSQELIGLLRYFDESTDEVAAHSGSERIRQIHEKVLTIKSNEDVGVKYMNAWEEKMLDRKEAFEEGEASGMQKGRYEQAIESARILKAKAVSKELIAESTHLSIEEIEKL